MPRRTEHLAVLVVSLSLLSLLGHTGAHAADETAIPPYQAEYQLSRDGLPFAHMRMTLEQSRDGGFRFESRTRAHAAVSLMSLALDIAPGANVTEWSVGRLRSGRYRPDQYRYRRENDDDRLLRIDFDWREGVALIRSDGQPWSQDIAPGVVDKISVLLALRQDLAAGARDLEYPVADGGRLKTYRYRREGTARIATAAGPWDCVELARTKDGGAVDYRLWLAPALHHLPVRVERREKDITYRMDLQRVDIASAGQTATAQP